MKLPFLPIHIDNFVKSNETIAFSSDGSVRHSLYFLSHAHTDHMTGLTPHWQNGIILCSEITRDVVLQKLDEEAHRNGGTSGPFSRPDPRSLSLFDRCVPLPMWQRLPLLSAAPPRATGAQSLAPNGANPQKESTTNRTTPQETDSESVVYLGVGNIPSDVATVFVTLLPAFHIPGSVMLYFETPFGRLLYTGDFKFDALSAAPILTPFFQTHPVDHIYLDDTWLHLGVTVSAQAYASQEATVNELNASGGEVANATNTRHDSSGGKILSKLLNAAQVEEAVEAIGRRLDAQQRRFKRENDDSWILNEEVLPACVVPPLPYTLRVYLHNQFGKEMLVQKIAERLCTRAVLDDSRFARVAAVSAVLNSEDVDCDTENREADSEDDIATAFGASPADPNMETGSSTMNGFVAPASSAPPLTRWKESSFYRLDLRYFVSSSQRQQTLGELRRQCAEAQRLRTLGESFDAPVQRARELCNEFPLIEVVDSRAKISADALQKATEPPCSALPGTPHYGVVMSGWARLQSSRQQVNEVWQVPTTLHCTPQEIIDFVALLRPLSVTPLHYRASRSPAVIMQRIGPHLRRPFVNDFFSTTTVDSSPSASDMQSLSAALGDGTARRTRLWYGLVALSDACADNGDPAVRRRDCGGCTENGIVLFTRRQHGFKIMNTAEPTQRCGSLDQSTQAHLHQRRTDPVTVDVCLSGNSASSPRATTVDVDSVLSSQDINVSTIKSSSGRQSQNALFTCSQRVLGDSQDVDEKERVTCKRCRDCDLHDTPEEAFAARTFRTQTETGTPTTREAIPPQSLDVESATDVLLALVDMLESDA